MSEQNYRALTTGNYIVQASGVEVRRTGRFEQVQNDKRRWFTPWRPKFITREILEQTGTYSGTETVFLKQGETAHYPIIRREGGIT